MSFNEANLGAALRRIFATFQPEKWTEGARLNAPAVPVDGAKDIDVTDTILAMGLAAIQSLKDDDASTDDLVDAAYMGHDGPHHVKITGSIAAFFGVDDVSQITEAQLAAARKPDETAKPRVPVTGCIGRYSMLDRHGCQLHVGDRIRAQVCVGRYGQTAVVETTVTKAHEPYGQISAELRTIAFHYRDGKLIGHHVHGDVEHGHETWVEIIS